MDMIDRYLNAVAAQLPQHMREDIIAELRDLVLSRCEAKESELGRALNDEERQAILCEIGHPLVVAARYRQGPDHLVGPQLFPYWLFGVKAGLLVLAAVFIIGLFFNLLTGAPNSARAISQAVHGFFWSGLTLVGAATLAAAFLEHNGIKPRWLTHWRVNDLTAFGLSDPSAWQAAFNSRFPRSRRAPGRRLSSTWPGSEHLAPLIVHGLFLLWWTGILQIPGAEQFHLRHVAVTVTGAPVWAALHDVILFYVAAHMVVDGIGLVQPYAVRLRAALEVALFSAGLWLFWTIFNAGHWFTLTRDGQSARIDGGIQFLTFHAFADIDRQAEALDKLAASLSVTLSWGLVIMAITLCFRIAHGLWRLARS